MAPPVPPLLTELHEKKILSDDEYAAVLKDVRTKTGDVRRSLLGREFVHEDRLIPLLAERFNLPWVSLEDRVPDASRFPSVPPKVAYHYGFVPLAERDGTVEIAFGNPLALETLDEIKTVLGTRVVSRLAGRKAIREALKKSFGIGADTVQDMIDRGEDRKDEITLSPDSGIDSDDEDASIIKFVNQVIVEAVRERATDIHIEPYENELKIRYRIDGVLYDAPFPTTIKHFHGPILSRLKIMSNLDISERRVPQDGRLKARVRNRELDLRLSILPTPFGETAEIRVLSGASEFLSLRDLGMNDRDLEQFEHSIARPHGMILVTGPTGSGKTTTLYAALNRLNTRDRKIITIEDPIEYQIPNMTQLQINPAVRFSFAAGLRSMLRHDPDTMMVGEIRDRETAEIAIQAALTGHLVFSTLHTNDAPGTITRMIDIGVEHYLLSSSLECVVAERLVRVLCRECKERESIPEETRANLPGLPEDISAASVARGCSVCNYTGYYGRTGIFEILTVDETIRTLIQARASTERIRREALSRGTISLRQSGYEKVRLDITSLEEVLRVTADHA
jgi:type II secretory ATPase GspE/PulE/Tfp pilus assembly ATPase PilB-like protein